jgi:hypothetical protein
VIFGGTGVGRCFGCCPGKKVSMMSMRLPQQGQGCSGGFDSSGLAALMASIGMRGTASSSRIRAMFLARVSVTSRTAVYGPVRTVVWEGWSREAPPYPDLWPRAASPPRLLSR